MQTTADSRWRHLPTWLCAASSVVLFLLSIALQIHVRLGLGHWPTPMTEDYESRAYRIHETVHEWVLLWTPFGAIPAWILIMLFRRLRLSRREHSNQVLLYFGGWAAIVLWIALDRTTFAAWYFD